MAAAADRQAAPPVTHSDIAHTQPGSAEEKPGSYGIDLEPGTGRLADSHHSNASAEKHGDTESASGHMAPASLRRVRIEDDEDDGPRNSVFGKISEMSHSRYAVWARDFILIALILAWLIVSQINDRPLVHHRRIPSALISVFFICFILFHKSRYLPQRPIVRVVSMAWGTAVEKPFMMLPYYAKLALGWACLAALIFGSAYGLAENPASNYRQRTISIAGLALIYIILFCLSKNPKAVKARTTIVGIGLQFIIALFVFRTGAGLSIFTWLATAAADLLLQAQAPEGRYAEDVGGGAEFFWRDFTSNGYFFINTLSSIIFFVALATALFWLGVLSWAIQKVAWLARSLLSVSGAEAIVAVASPFIGQGENAVLVRPYIKTMTRSEIHQVLTSGMSTISGSTFIGYVALGVSGKDLITSSVMSIPAAIAASKVLYPETEEPETMGGIQINREEDDEDRPVNFWQALSNGASFGVTVAWLIFGNVLVLVSFISTVNGILAYIGNAIYIDDVNGPLTLQLILGYLLYPFTFMLGVPGEDTLAVSKLIAIKTIANEYVAYVDLETDVRATLSPRGYLIAKYLLCSFANLASQAINIGILSAMAPGRKKDIVRLTPSALMTAILVTSSSAAIAGIVSDGSES